MSIDFATLQGLTIPEGVVTQIADASGRVLWAVSGGKVILEVEKITSDTYAGETTYTGEQFILLDIYPKTNGTVKITYGGLTKTITDTSGAAEPNAQQVFFGTFNGVSDSVATPVSGRLTIDGDCVAYGCSRYKKQTDSKTIEFRCNCIKEIVKFGEDVTSVPEEAFYTCAGITNVEIPSTVKSIGSQAFYYCTGISKLEMPSGIISIGSQAFMHCTGIQNVEIPSTVTLIDFEAFLGCDGLTSVTFKNTSGWYVSKTSDLSDGVAVDVSDPTTNANLISSEYAHNYWYRS